MEQYRIIIAGAGAIGGVCAALMKKAGQDVQLLVRREEAARAIGREGLHITGVRGDIRVQVPTVSHTDELTGQYDAALIATKAYDMPECARALLPFLKEDAPVVGLQNGICTDALTQAVGKARAVGAVVGFGATMHSDTEMEMTSAGEFVIGRAAGGCEGLEGVREALSHVTETRLSDNIYAELYSKLIVNSCITSLGAVCGLRLGDMMKMRQARRVFLRVIDEAMNVARAMHLSVPPYGGKLDYDKLTAGHGPLANFRRHAVISAVGLKYRKLKSSSLQSLERGRLTEIDYFNGYIAKKGEELGVDCPVCRRLTEMVKQIERHERRIQVENLMDKTFLSGL